MFSKDNDLLREFYEQLPLGVSIEDCSGVKRRIDKLLKEGVKDLEQYFKDNPDVLFDLVMDVHVTDVNHAMLKLYKVNSLQEYYDLTDDYEHWKNTEWADFYTRQFLNFVAGRAHFSDYQDKVADGTTIISNCIAWIPTEHKDDWSLVITTHEDITERRQAEDQLHKSEVRFRSTLENSRDLLYTFNLKSGTYDYMSPAIETLTGFTPEEFIAGGLKLTISLIHPEDIARLQDHIDTLLDHSIEDEIDPTVEYRLKHPTLGWRWISDNRTVLYDDSSGNKEPVVVVGNCRDITEQKELQISLQTALVDAEQANKSKSDFLATMSHEFRTPLNAIIGFSEMMNAEFFGPLGSDNYKVYINDILSSGEHMLALVNDVLDVATIEAGERHFNKEACSIGELVKDSIRNVEYAAHKSGVTLIYNESEDLPTLTADARSIRQIALNLLSNAIKFTNKKGKVIVTTVATDLELIFTVKDTGIGILPENLARITKPFSQAHSNAHISQEGTGLGLSIVESLVSAHHGKLEIESEIGKGTTVTVRFPFQTAGIE